MNYCIFFSPTGTTEKVVRYMGKSFSDAEHIDISKDVSDLMMKEDDFCIVGIPSFGGRVPSMAAERLHQIKGKNTAAVIVVTYGARAYEDTLKELKDILEEQGFRCIGAAAVVAEHSIVSEIASGRPNREDYEELDNYVTEIQKRLQSDFTSVEVPGNTPYKEYNVAPMGIQTSDRCVTCGLCARSCPANAIPLEEPRITADEKCISCMRCVSACPVKARSCSAGKLEMITEKLKKICQPDKQNEFF